MFDGFVTLGTTTFGLFLQAKNGSGTPSAADEAGTYRIYSSAGGAALLSGSFSGTITDSQTGFYHSGNLAITSANGFSAGMVCTVRKRWLVSTTAYAETSSFVVV